MGAQRVKSRLTTLLLLNKKGKSMVYVLNKEGKPLMPTQRHGKVRRMLRDGKAHVVRSIPFTIQLDYDTNNYTQSVSLGIDAGVQHIGVSASTKKREVFSAEVELRKDVTKILSERRMYRRKRRYRKTRYRKPRWKHRGRPDGWLTPSVRNRIERHIHVITLVHSVLPIARTTIETAQFDIAKIKNPNINGIEYQNGPQKDSGGTREYVLWRDEHKCCHCHGKSGDKILEVHHIETRQTGGDSPDNLITLCKTCHKASHDGKIKLNIKRGIPFRDPSQMNTMRKTLLNEAKAIFPNVHKTYGYITKNTRVCYGIEKTHCADAFCIAGNMQAERLGTYLLCRCIRRHTRSLHVANFRKGHLRRSAVAPHWISESLRLQRYDTVKWNGIRCFISGSSKSQIVLRDINWKLVTPTAKVSSKSVKFLCRLHGRMLASQLPQQLL